MGSFPEKCNDPFALGYKGEPYNDKCNHPRGLIVPFRSRPSLQGGRVTLVLGFTPEHSDISSFFTRRVYQAGRVTLALG